MTAMDTLVPGMNATHAVLADRLETAISAHPDAAHPRDRYPATDTFLASVSRHNAAVLAVLVPAARHALPDGHERAREFVHQSRRLEVALAQVKAKLYGSSYAIRRPWHSIWADVRTEFDETWRLEKSLATEVAAARSEDEVSLDEELYHAELRAPTRPHPYVPHQGVPGKLARRVTHRVDQFWDATEGRMIPEPVRHQDRDHQGLLTQYLLADPHMHED
jgi:hypothetical protein